MALDEATISLDLAQILGADFDARRTKIRVYTNVVNQTLMDTSTGETRIGDQTVTVNTDGTAEFTTWTPGADGNPISWQTYIAVDYPRTGARDRQLRTFGPYTIEAANDGDNITDLEEEQAVPPDYLTTVTEALDAKVTAAQEYADDASNSAALAAEAHDTAVSDAVAAAEAQAVAPTDTQMATVVASAASLFNAAAAKLFNSDQGEGAITKADQKTGPIVFAVLSDSTWYKNGSNLYVGTDGYEVPRKFANWLASTYSTLEVGYRALTSWAAYGSRVVVDDGTSSSVTLADTFAATAANIYGRTPDTGSGTWNDNSGGVTVRYNLSGDGSATMSSNGTTWCSGTRAGYMDTTVNVTKAMTSGNLSLYSSYINTSNWLSVRMNSNSTIDFFTNVGGVLTTVNSSTPTAAGLATTGTLTFPIRIKHKTNGDVEYYVNSVLLYTHTLSGAASTTFASASAAGFAGTSSGHKILDISATTTSTALAVADVYNGAYSSKSITDSQAQYATLVPTTPDVVIICHSHNQTTDTASAFETKIDSMVTTIHTAHPNAAIVIASQNPETQAATNYAQHAARQADLRRYARTRGFGYIPAFEAFQAQVNPSSFVIADGVHPTAAGVDLIGTAVQDYFDALSLRP